MRNFQEKNKFKRFMRSKPVLVILFFIVIAFTLNVINLTSKLRDTYKNKKIEQEKIYDLEKRKLKLSSDIDRLGTEAGKEEAIRENFGMIKEGEDVIIIIEDKNKNEEPPVEPKKGFFYSLKNIFE